MAFACHVPPAWGSAVTCAVICGRSVAELVAESSKPEMQSDGHMGG